LTQNNNNNNNNKIENRREQRPTMGAGSPNAIEAMAPAVYFPIPGSCISSFELFGILPLNFS
jgi:hypothetical protein